MEIDLNTTLGMCTLRDNKTKYFIARLRMSSRLIGNLVEALLLDVA